MKFYEIISLTWSELTEEERSIWAWEFIELAEKEIIGYSGRKDINSQFPGCTPWFECENEEVVSPRTYLDSIKDVLQDSINEENNNA